MVVTIAILSNLYRHIECNISTFKQQLNNLKLPLYFTLNHPVITIGLTTFNSEDTLKQAVDSALSQSWQFIEIVVADDYSTDGTFEYLQNLELDYPAIRVFRNSKNSGVATSRNRIIKEARGEFIVFFDDDDVSHPDRIIEQYKRITEYEKQFADGSPVICHTARKLVYPHGEIRIEQTMGQTEGKPVPSGPAVARRILLGEPLEDAYGACPTCSQMARVSTYKLIGGFDPSFRRSEDTDFNIRLAQAGGHFIGIAEPLVIQNMTKTSEKSLRDEYYYMQCLLHKHREFIEQEGKFDFSLTWLDLKQAWLENQRLTFVKLLFRLTFTHPILTMRRLILSLPSISLNRAFSRFHNDSHDSVTT